MSERPERRDVLKLVGASAAGGSLATQSAIAQTNGAETGPKDLPLQPVVGTNPPQDLDNDGLYEDIDGDDEFDIFDVQALFENLDSDAVQNNPEEFNFNEDENPEEVGIFDVQALFNRLEDDSGLADVVAFGPDDEQVTLGLMHDPSGGDDADIAASIQDDLELLGIEVELLETDNILAELNSVPNEGEDPDDFPYGPIGRNAGPPELTKVVNDWDMLIGIGGNSRPRNPLATEGFWVKDGAVNAYGYVDEQVGDLYDQANNTTDREERVNLLTQIFGRLTEQCPANFLSEDEEFDAFRPDINTGDTYNEFGFSGAVYNRYRGEQTVSGDYVVLTTGLPQTFYPPEADDTSSGAVIGNVADIAYALTAENEQVPQTMKIENTGDSQVWTCTIRDNIQFGEDAEGNSFGQCTAEDWVYQINNIYGLEGNPFDESTPPSAYADTWQSQVENVEQTGEFEFQIELPQADPDFFLRPLLRNRYILPMGLYEKYAPDAEALRQSDEVQNFTWTGNVGPYSYVDDTPGAAGDVSYERNDDYYMRDHVEESNVEVMNDGYADAPYFNTLLRDREAETATINERWRNGDGDTMGLEKYVVEEFQQRDDTRTENTLGPFISSMFFNMRSNGHPLLDEADGRFAICQVIDKEKITEQIQRGLSGPPAVTWQPQWSEFYDESKAVVHGLNIGNDTIQNARNLIDNLDGFSVEKQ